MSLPLSVLDLLPIPSGSDAPAAVRDALQLVQHVESLGYARYWVAEHHNMLGLASSVPLAVLSAASQVTSRIRLGSGGVMLPNHAPLSVAEGYKLLSALAPGRVDLGLGRAPGTDGRTARALRGFAGGGVAGLMEEPFERQLAELVAFGRGEFPAGHPYAGIIAAPEGEGLFPPLWILSSSGYGASVAAQLGAGLSFAWHINPDTVQARMAAESYRRNFRPSAEFPQPRVMVAANVICAGTQEEAEELSLPFGLMFLRLRLGTVGRYPSVQEAKDYPYTPQERAVAEAACARVIVGDALTVAENLRVLTHAVGADELIISTMTHDQAARRRSYELLMAAWQEKESSRQADELLTAEG